MGLLDTGQQDIHNVIFSKIYTWKKIQMSSIVYLHDISTCHFAKLNISYLLSSQNCSRDCSMMAKHAEGSRLKSRCRQYFLQLLIIILVFEALKFNIDLPIQSYLTESLFASPMRSPCEWHQVPYVTSIKIIRIHVFFSGFSWKLNHFCLWFMLCQRAKPLT